MKVRSFASSPSPSSRTSGLTFSTVERHCAHRETDGEEKRSAGLWHRHHRIKRKVIDGSTNTVQGSNKLNGVNTRRGNLQGGPTDVGRAKGANKPAVNSEGVEANAQATRAGLIDAQRHKIGNSWRCRITRVKESGDDRVRGIISKEPARRCPAN